MAAVLKAHDKELGRTVALKILPPDLSTDPENVSRFKQEARAAARLDHDNVARVYFCGEDQGLHFIAFEFVEGENLRDRMDRARRPDPAPRSDRPDARRVRRAWPTLRSCGASSTATSSRRTFWSRPKAGPRSSIWASPATSTGRSMAASLIRASPSAPSITFRRSRRSTLARPTAARDIYSLGCTLYHALTGQPPVPDGTPAKKLHWHRDIPPTDPRELLPSIPDDVAAILARMMAKDPAHRYQTPSEPVGPFATGRGPPEPHDARRRNRRRVTSDRPGTILPDAPRSLTPWLLGLMIVAVCAARRGRSRSISPARLVAAPPWPVAVPTHYPEPTAISRRFRLALVVPDRTAHRSPRPKTRRSWNRSPSGT